MEGYMSLTRRQRDFAKLVGAGMDKTKAMDQVGYARQHIPATLYKHSQNEALQALIKLYEDDAIESDAVSTKIDRQMFWTSTMNDPGFSIGMRLKASEMLGRSECDFVDRKQIETTEKKNPIVLTPSTSAKDWEEQWENINDKP